MLTFNTSIRLLRLISDPNNFSYDINKNKEIQITEALIEFSQRKSMQIIT